MEVDYYYLLEDCPVCGWRDCSCEDEIPCEHKYVETRPFPEFQCTEFHCHDCGRVVRKTDREIYSATPFRPFSMKRMFQ